MSVGAIAGGTLLESDGPAGYTCRPSTLTPVVQAGWSVRYFESSSTQSITAVGMIYAFSGMVGRQDENFVRTGILDHVNVPVKAASRAVSAQTTDQPVLQRRMSTAESRSAAGSASFG